MADSLENKLNRLIAATTQARDNCTRAAELSEKIGAHELVADLKRLAAMYDALLSATVAQLVDADEEPPAPDEAGPAG